MSSDTFLTLSAPCEGLYKEKGSKFIALAYPVSHEEEVKELVAQAQKQYHDARHHCYAYAIGPTGSLWRCNDDGEPSGTAGRPIHGQILSHGLTNTLVIVVRYFGGIKLGVSGLAAAYRAATADALSHALIVEQTVDITYHVHFEYAAMNDVMRILKQYSLTPEEQQFHLQCSLQFAVRQSMAPTVEAAFLNLRTVQIEEV